MILNFEAKVLKVIEDNKNNNFWVILDKTAFYPRGGGQDCDKGFLIYNNKKIDVLEVIKQGNIVLHKTNQKIEEGVIVKGEIDKKRRKILTQQHDAIHLLNGVCQQILGKHVWQNGSNVNEEKSHLDITHYKKLKEDEIEKIEELLNYYVFEGIPINKYILERGEAEKRYGFRIYQGGVVIGSHLRIVEIENIDVEACGGTHGNNTKEIGNIFLTKVNKIQDNIYRFELVAGINSYLYLKKLKYLLNESAKFLKVSIEEVPKTSKKFFEEWKKIKKEKEELEKYLIENIENLLKNSEEKIIELPLENKFLFQLVNKTEKILKNKEMYITKNNKENKKILSEICKKIGKKEEDIKNLRDILLLKITT